MAWKISPCKPKSYTDYRRDSRHLIGTSFWHLKNNPLYKHRKIQIKRLASGIPATLSVWYFGGVDAPCRPALASILIVASSQETVLQESYCLSFIPLVYCPFLLPRSFSIKYFGITYNQYARAFEILTGLLLW